MDINTDAIAYVVLALLHLNLWVRTVHGKVSTGQP